MVWRCTVVLPPPLLLLAMLNIATSTAAAARALTGSGRGGAHGPTLGPVVATHAQEGVPLFTKGDMGYDSFRGTVLLQEPGTPWLVAFACGRKGGGDASGRTLFLRRSSEGARAGIGRASGPARATRRCARGTGSTWAARCMTLAPRRA